MINPNCQLPPASPRRKALVGEESEEIGGKHMMNIEACQCLLDRWDVDGQTIGLPKTSVQFMLCENLTILIVLESESGH